MTLKYLVLAFAALVACAALRPASAAEIMPAKVLTAHHCLATGGVIQTRIPEYGTNGSTPLVLSGSQDFCQYTSPTDGSQISLLISTLITPQPTLAALAYYAEVKFDGSTCKGSPGSCYCSQVGGTDLFGGITAAGGGWVLSTDSTDVLDACIFPDLSSIDSYGLFYHSAKIIRGKDLAPLLAYKDPYRK